MKWVGHMERMDEHRFPVMAHMCIITDSEDGVEERKATLALRHQESRDGRRGLVDSSQR